MQKIIAFFLIPRTAPLIPLIESKFRDLLQDDLLIATDLSHLQASPKYGQISALIVLWPDLPSFQQILNENPIEWVHSLQIGIDHLLPYLLNHTAVLTRTINSYNQDLAEFCILSMLYFAKNVPHLLALKHQQQWNQFKLDVIYGKTVVILGYGQIGKAVAQMCKVFQMNVIAVKRTPGQPDGIASEVYTIDQINNVVPQADYLISILPKTPDTVCIVGKQQLDLMKPTAVFVNVGRGDNIDQEYLEEVLKGGRIKGAVLDVFQIEPLPRDSQLWDLPNVLISFHKAAVTNESMGKIFDEALGNAERFLRGEDFREVVDRSIGY